jgi:dihydrolipoamide dehydrogenase
LRLRICSIIGHSITYRIAPLDLMARLMEYSASSEDLQRTIHAHPRLSKAQHEAALADDERAIDNINK